MTDSFEAHPTDYDGIRFRSKSEAVFYRAMKLNGWLVEYEPKDWICDGWSFDFRAAWQSPSGALVCSLIEYKPTRPTDAYLQRHLSRLRSLGLRLTGYRNFVAIGSAWNTQRETLVYDFEENAWQNIEISLGVFRNIDEAARHRFDLL